MLGFMPARDDFEVECENEAEILVSGIQAASGGNRVESDDEEVKQNLNNIMLESSNVKVKTWLKLVQVDTYPVSYWQLWIGKKLLK